MKGDFSRDSFDRRKRFSRVLMQQGRVQLDADWNEQSSILLDYVRTLAVDIIGQYAGPADDCGFEIVTDTPAEGQLDEKLARIERDPRRRQALKEALGRGDFVIGPGRYYVHGVLVENDRAILYTEQPGYLPAREPTLHEIQKGQGSLLFYLDVWERHITHVEDDEIREPALGGPDTSTRAQVVWRVRVLFEPRGGRALDCDAVGHLLPIGTGRLRARAPGGYRGAENHLYRVEVHKGGTASSNATFKWSRENGSVAFPIRSLSGTTATLRKAGRDLKASLHRGDWVEVTDDAMAMRDEAGTLARVDAIDPDALTVTLALPGGGTFEREYDETAAMTHHALLRRWDHAGDLALAGAVRLGEQSDAHAGWIALEDGVEIGFAAGDPAAAEYRAGDYWLIPARPATGDVEWPDEIIDGHPLPALRAARGPLHYYAPLMVRSAGATQSDCRRRIEHRTPV
jgi:hypothetical protein